MRAPQERRVENKRETRDLCKSSRARVQLSGTGDLPLNRQRARVRCGKAVAGFRATVGSLHTLHSLVATFHCKLNLPKTRQPTSPLCQGSDLRSLHYLFWDSRLQVDKSAEAIQFPAFHLGGRYLLVSSP